MIVWGGEGNGRNALNTGGRYDPGTDSWIATSTTNAPAAREGHTAVWTGNEMIVWGGKTYVIQYWREILRTIWWVDTYSNTNCKSDFNNDAYCNTNSNSDSHCYGLRNTNA